MLIPAPRVALTGHRFVSTGSSAATPGSAPARRNRLSCAVGSGWGRRLRWPPRRRCASSSEDGGLGEVRGTSGTPGPDLARGGGRRAVRRPATSETALGPRLAHPPGHPRLLTAGHRRVRPLPRLAQGGGGALDRREDRDRRPLAPPSRTPRPPGRTRPAGVRVPAPLALGKEIHVVSRMEQQVMRDDTTRPRIAM